MGAGCSSSKVANQVKPGAVTKVQLSEQAKEHFKNIKTEDPLADTQNAQALSNTLKKFKIEAGDDEESKVDDKQEFSNFEDDGFRMHEPLWRAIEKNDLPAATKFLQLNEIIKQNLYDQQGQSMLHKVA